MRAASAWMEIQSEIQEGNYLALEYLGQSIELAIKHKVSFI